MTLTAPRHPRRLVYLGTPEMAVPPLLALHAAGFEIAHVVSRPDAKRGRGGAMVPSPVKRAAVELGVPVSDRVDDALLVGADLGVVVAYGRLIRPHVLDGLAMVNLHFSLLPRWRGAAPVERAILAGDDRTGVCVMEVEEGLDTGGTYAVAEVAIAPDESADELRDELVAVGSALLVDTLRAGLGAPIAQQGEPTYAEKITPQEHQLDWSATAVALHRVVRLGEAWTTFRDRRLKIRRARVATYDGGLGDLAPGQIDVPFVGTGDGVLELVEVQPEGKARQPADAWARGARPTADDRLGSDGP